MKLPSSLALKGLQAAPAVVTTLLGAFEGTEARQNEVDFGAATQTQSGMRDKMISLTQGTATTQQEKKNQDEPPPTPSFDDVTDDTTPWPFSENNLYTKWQETPMNEDFLLLEWQDQIPSVEMPERMWDPKQVEFIQDHPSFQAVNDLIDNLPEETREEVRMKFNAELEAQYRHIESLTAEGRTALVLDLQQKLTQRISETDDASIAATLEKLREMLNDMTERYTESAQELDAEKGSHLPMAGVVAFMTIAAILGLYAAITGVKSMVKDLRKPAAPEHGRLRGLIRDSDVALKKARKTLDEAKENK